MAKILEAEFRKELYKNLVDAGYSKDEAQKIVGTKYYANLLDDVKNTLDNVLNSVIKEEFEIGLNAEEINGKIAELKKMRGILKD